MHRRDLLAIATVTAFGGCASSSDRDGPETSLQSSSPTESTATTLYPHSYRLQIQSRAEEVHHLSFELEDLDAGNTVYQERKTVAPGDTVSLDDHFAPGVDYRFVVRRFDETLFELTIYPYESYELAITQGPEVEVETLLEH